jgi:hypothetical protein
MTEVWRESPPPVKSGRTGKYEWDRIVAELQSRPGEWLCVDDQASRGLDSAIIRKKMTALQDPAWEFAVTTRNNNRETGTCEVWMSANPVERQEN